MIDCNQNLASIGIDTSWPGTTGPSAQNSYINVWVQNFTVNGWLAINDNQSSWKDCTARGAANYGLSGMRLEGSGGQMGPLDNVNCSDSYLSITCQSGEIRGGYFQGIRICESQTSTNYLSFSGGTAIYCNPVSGSHFYDPASSSPGHYFGALKADGLYLISNTGTNPTNTWNCGLAGKALFDCCIFINAPGFTGTWNLYGANAFNSSSPYPNVLELNGCGQGSMIINTPSGYITKRRDVEVADAGLLDDFPMRVMYRAHLTPGAQTSGTWINVVPASAMTDLEACYLLAISVGNPGVDQLAMVANVAAVTKNGAIGASAAMISPTSANFANNIANQISLRYGTTTNISGSWYAGIDASVNETLLSGCSINVTLIRIANPSVNY
jgi:hypothetical protein